MELRTIADIKLVGRALGSDWPTDEKKAEAVDALLEVMRLKDPELTIHAFNALVKADLANVKRGELEERKLAREDKQRLRVLEFLKSIGPDEVSKLASSSGVSVGRQALE